MEGLRMESTLLYLNVTNITNYVIVLYKYIDHVNYGNSEKVKNILKYLLNNLLQLAVSSPRYRKIKIMKIFCKKQAPEL